MSHHAELAIRALKAELQRRAVIQEQVVATLIGPDHTDKEMVAEVLRLRAKVQRQRKELRRLNKVIGPLWVGWRKGADCSDTTNLRGKMNDAFGHEAVYKAEHSKGNHDNQS